MNFRNILLAALLVLFGQKSHAQKTVYAILIEDNFGLTDSLGTEIIAPKYDRISDSKDKKLQVFHPYYSSSENVLLYNVQTGEINKKFKYIYLDNVLIGQQYYHYFDDNKKSYLQNSQTNEIIKTKEKIYSIENLGSQYLAAKFFPTDNDFPKPAPRKPKPVAQAPAKKDPKTGKLIPPPPIIQVPLPPVRESGGSLNGYVFYSNTLPLKTLLKIEAQMYMPLYETNEIDNNYIKNIREFNSPDFDYLVFRKNKQLFLYDKDFKLLNKINYPKKEESDDIDKEFVTTEVSKIIGKKVYSFHAIPPSMGRSGNSSDEKIKDPFEVKRTPEGQYQLLRTSDNKVTFSTSFKMEYDNDRMRVTVDKKNEKTNRFYIDKKTGKPFLPAKYLDSLKIKIES